MDIRLKYIGVMLLISLFLASCLNKVTPEQDIINNTFADEQKELKDMVSLIVHDAETANLEGLKNIHLANGKFTKFGPRIFDRQDVETTNESETKFFGTVSNYKEEVKDLKIDVFGEVGIVTYYRNVTFEKDGERKNVNLRQTLVFVKTQDGWKIAHEHGTRRL